MSYLRTDKVFIERLGETIELVELNALGHRELLNAHSNGDMFAAAANTVKFGTKKWRDASVEEIMEELPLPTLQEIAEAVTGLSALDEDHEGNSESTPVADSSTD